MPILTNRPFISAAYDQLILSTPNVTVEGYWKCDSNDTTALSDASGNGRDLTLPGTGTSSTVGQVNEARLWTGGTSKQADSGVSALPGSLFVNGWSVEGWVNTTVFSFGIYFPIVYVLDDLGGSSSNFAFEIAQPNFLSSDPFRVQVNNKGVVITSGNLGPLSEWVHVAGSWDKATTTGKAYINGTEVLNTNLTDNGNTQFDRIEVAGRQASSAFEGAMDEVVLYDGVIAEADVIKHYNAGLAAS